MNIIAAILVFGLIIFIHELGHFYFAKKAGVTIHEFAIGMGPAIFKKEKNGTLYSIRLLPVGGFVAMEGEDEESNDPNSFGKKTIKERFLSIFAGPMANIILCIVLLIPFFFFRGTPTTTFDTVIENSPAYKVGFKKGDRIISIDNKKINNFEELGTIIGNSNGNEMKIKYERNGKIENKSISAEKQSGKYVIGIKPTNEKNPLKAIKQAFVSTYVISKTMLVFLWQLITGQLSGKVMDTVSGPVGVVNMVSNAATTGILNLVFMTALISLNIGIMNLLPIPALDGWRILMLMIEKIRKGKKIPAKIEGYINGIGLVALLSFMVFITYADIMKIIFKK